MEEFSELSIASDEIDDVASDNLVASWGANDSVGAGGEQLKNANALLTFGKQQNLLASDIEFGGGVGLFGLDELDSHPASVISHVNSETNSKT